MTVRLSEDSVMDILTLRYDPQIRSPLPALSADDFAATADRLHAEDIKEHIQDALRRSVGSSGRACVALSGGTDSTLCLALLREALPDMPVRAVSVRFADSTDETPQAAGIAGHFGVEHEIIQVDDFLADLPKAISIVRRPFWDLHWYHVVKRAAGMNAHLISGDGGDELFGGYTFRYKKFLSMADESSSAAERASAYLRCHERDWVEDQEDLFGDMIGFSWGRIHRAIEPYFDNPLAPIQQVFLADYNGKLSYNFAPVGAALSGHFGIRSTAPLLSEDMIRRAAHLDPKAKYDERSNTGKLPLRELLSRYIDDGMPSRTKLGFSVNTENLWRSSGYELCKAYLDGARIADAGWVDPAWMEKNLKICQDARHVNKFLGLLALEVWYRLFITGEMNPDMPLEA